MIDTPRLILRGWREADYEPFAALNADPEVMRHFPATHTREESDGLARPRPPHPLQNEVEVGWRLARFAWGHGYASEAARASLDFGFNELGLSRIVSFTAVENERSQAVMRRIGMTRAPELDFDHPALKGHRLERHVVYVISRLG